MRHRPRLLRALGTAALLTLTATLPAAQEDCLENGASRTLCFNQPDLGAEGFPAGSTWLEGSGTPTLWEQDGTSSDFMGSMDPSADLQQACADVTNHDGVVSGPNGELVTAVNGCIEPVAEFTYTYPVTLTICTTASTSLEGGSSSGPCVTITVRFAGRARVSYGEPVCPCC